MADFQGDGRKGQQDRQNTRQQTILFRLARRKTGGEKPGQDRRQGIGRQQQVKDQPASNKFVGQERVEQHKVEQGEHKEAKIAQPQNAVRHQRTVKRAAHTLQPNGGGKGQKRL